MHHFFNIGWSLIYLLLVVCSFAGYGAFIVNAKWSGLGRTMPLNVGIYSGIGLSVFLFFSGFVELLRLGSPFLYYGFTAIGLALLAKNLGGISNKANCRFVLTVINVQFRRASSIIPALIISIFAGFILLNLIYFEFNESDDFQGYLVFAHRLLTEGFQGYDPFSVRGVEQGFGGGNSLNALFLSGASLGHLHLGEAGVGFLILAATTAFQAWSKTKKLSRVTYSFLIVCVLVLFAPIVNVAPLLSGCALMYCSLLFCSAVEDTYSPRESILFALLLTSLLMLKGTFIVPVFVVVCAYYVARFMRLKSGFVFKEAQITILSLAIFLSPWLLTNYLYHGTAYYPILGKGFSSSGSFGIVSIGQFMNSMSEFMPLYGLSFASLILFTSFSSDRKENLFLFLLTGLTIGCTIFLALTPGGFFRYSYVLLAVPIVFILTSFICLESYKYSPKLSYFSVQTNKKILIFIISITSLLMAHQIKRVGKHFISHGIMSQSNELIEDGAGYLNFRKIQDVIPAGSVLLTRLSTPYLLDFSRNKVYVMDYPGNASPKPSIPVSGNSLELAQYLRDNNIRFVAHSYDAWIKEGESPAFKFEMDSEYSWIRNLYTRAYLINENLIEFATDYKVIYDNGRDRVIDICRLNKLGEQSICE